MIYYQILEDKTFKILVVEENQKITEVRFIHQDTLDKKKYIKKETPLLKEVKKELFDYFRGTRKEFHLPLNPKGTSFQQTVWKKLEEIPYGMTTYGQIAAEIQNPKACRAVGMAIHNNPIAILIPCHRVLGKNKTLTGYAYGLEIKKQLLTLETTSHK